MPKINHEEYEVLKGLDDRWKWIARDESEGMFLFVEKPNKYGYLLQWRNYTCDWKTFETEVFQFIQWEDEEPHNIQELIEEYEKDYKGSWEHAIEFSGEVFGESEETEVKKDKEWLLDEIERITDEYSNQSFFTNFARYMISEIEEAVYQLYEPEVLSQEWIDEHKYFAEEKIGEDAVVRARDLRNLLVPKESLGNSQKLEKVQIPQFVADFIEVRKGTDAYSLKYILCVAVERSEQEEYTKAYDWISANDELFARAWLDGYTVEEEQKYYAKIKGHENIYSDICFWIYDTEIEELLIDNAEIYPDVTAEYMIKATKDEWANLGVNDGNADFVKVEELKE